MSGIVDRLKACLVQEDVSASLRVRAQEHDDVVGPILHGNVDPPGDDVMVPTLVSGPYASPVRVDSRLTDPNRELGERTLGGVLGRSDSPMGAGTCAAHPHSAIRRPTPASFIDAPVPG